MKKTLVALLCASALTVGTLGFVGCAKEDNSDLVIAYLSGGRGETYVEELVEAFKETTYVQEWLEKNNKESLKVKIVKGGGATIEDSVLNSINSGTTPSIMFLNKNMQNKLTESFISAKQLVDLSDLLDDNVYGETTALQDKLVDGLLNNYSAQPYGDGKTYALPAFYSPLGLWYDASRFYDDGEGTADTDGYTSVGSGANAGKYELPHTWDEFWDLGDYLNIQNSQNKNVSATAPSLFTYPTAGYFDGYIYAAIAGIAGEEKFLDALGYEDGIWEDNDVKAALETVVQLRDYLEPSTVSQANGIDFQNNQQAVIGEADGSAKGTALFIPNGDWLPSEMAESTPAGFEWGFMPLPKTDEGNGAVATNLELVYLHEDGKNLDLAKQFLLFYFSDEGAKIVAEEADAIIPTKDALTDAAENGIAQSTIDLYDVYSLEGYTAAVGSFVATGTVTGVNWNDVLFNDLNDDVFNSAHATTSIENLLNTWANKLETASDQFRAVII